MNADDKRHGSNAGYVAGCRCAPCRLASTRYTKRLKADNQFGLERTVESWRAVRRLDALACLGWSRGVVAVEMGVKHKCQVYAIGSHPRIYESTLARLDAVYQRLSMRLPDPQTKNQRTAVTKTQRNAQRRGALPPLAWDDIDNPDQRPDMTETETVDPVVVDRILAGDWRLKATRDERWQVITRWPESDKQLEERTGWNIARERRDHAARTSGEREAS